jgi:O-antigen ligase
MSDLAAPATSGAWRRVASWPRSRFWLLCADLYPALTAAALPWSTTAVAIFMVVWFITLLPTIDFRAFCASLGKPAGFLPLVLVALAFLGLFWTGDTWAVRLQGFTPVAKLLAVPFLLYHFERSQRGHWVFIAFLASCVLLMGLSWLTYFATWKISPTGSVGVPVKNYINQSQEFALCSLAMLPLILTLIAESRRALAFGCTALVLGFFCNMMFVATARTVFFYLPVLLVVFAAKYMNRRLAVRFVVATAVIGLVVSFSSPYLRLRVERTVYDYRLSRDTDIATSNGERLAYWRASIRSIGEAPVFGHGTGSTKQLFDHEAKGKIGEWANSIRNPHNQTLYVAIQWGVLGCIILYAMWYFHLLLFRGSELPAWIGLVLVVQNFISSIFNSHLFDFHEGWIYVLGVGVAGGMIARARQALRPTVAPAVRRTL